MYLLTMKGKLNNRDKTLQKEGSKEELILVNWKTSILDKLWRLKAMSLNRKYRIKYLSPT